MAATDSDTRGKQGRGRPWTPEEQREAARKGVEARQAKAQARKDTAEENALTARQRLGVALSKLTQREWDAKVKAAKAHELVRFLDQAFGRPTDAEPDKPTDEGLSALTKDQRATLRAMLESEEDPPQEAAQSHAHDNPTEAEPPPPQV